MRILTLCGSLRGRSSNRSLLHAYGRVMPATVVVEHYEGIAALPHFNPDLDREDEAPPPSVTALRLAIGNSSAVVVSTPEYAHGLPGAFKNALDWLVSDPAFAGKPVAILHVERGSTWALDSLREVLKTMSAQIVDAASVALPLHSNQIDEAAILDRSDLRALLTGSADALLRVLEASARSGNSADQSEA